MSESSKIISKIEKLLKLSKGSSCKNEAEASLQIVYQLMQEHNLSMADIEGHSRESELGPLGTTSALDSTKQFRKWERSILFSLSRLFDCKVVKSCKGVYWDKKATYTIIGREGNRTTVKMMYDWIQKETLKQARLIGGRNASFRTSYALGVAAAIQKKVDDLKKSAPTTDAWGIVPFNEVDNYIQELYGKINNSKCTLSNVRYPTMYVAGLQNGEKISLNHQVNTIGIEYDKEAR